MARTTTKKVEQPNAVLERSQPSVEIKRDPKGNAVFTVKAYADTMKEALREALDAFNQLSKKL